ncbi:MAG: GNAT family N-acetyltransferase [Caulobacteraceae bacterium]
MNAITKPSLLHSNTRYRPPVEVTVAHTLNDMMQVIAIRSAVYMSEQDCPFHEEYDGNDFTATHLIARVDGRPVGVVRIRWFADFAKLERLAVLKDHRGGQVTNELIEAAFALAARKGYRTMVGHAQPRLVPFWIRKYGGRVRKGRPQFLFSDFEYTEMEIDLVPPDDVLNIDSDPMVLVRPEGEWDQPGVLERSAARSAPNS